MFFVQLAKGKEKPTREGLDQANKLAEEMAKKGIKIVTGYWTLGRFDTILIYEAPNEKDAMKFVIESEKLGLATVETMVAIPREEAIKLL